MPLFKRFSACLLVIFSVIFMTIPVFAAEESVQKKDVKKLKVALAFCSIAQLDDKSFVTAVTKGAEKAGEEFGITLSTRVQTEGESDSAFLEDVATSGVDAVVAVSIVDVGSMLEVAEKHPNVKFMVVDSVVPPLFTNAKSIIFREHEGSFLVGMIAALKSQTGKIGFIGGRDIPLIRNFAYGYRQGAEYVNPKIQIEEVMLGNTVEAWEQPDRANEIAKKQYASGVDVIFSAAGASGVGVLKAASEVHKYAIGVDSNQNGLFPGAVLTSMVKKVDVAVYQALMELADGQWDAGILNLGLKENALDYAVDRHNRAMMDEATIKIVETAKEQIVRGSLEVNIYSPK